MVLIEDITEAELAREAAEAAAKKAAEEQEAAAAEAQAAAARQATAAAAAAAAAAATGSEDAGEGAGAPNEGGEVASADSQPPAELTEEEKEQLGRAEALKREGNELYARDKAPAALEKYAAALEAAPEAFGAAQQRAVYHGNAAACHLKLEQWAEAAQESSAALELDPRYTKVLLRRSTAYEKLDDLERALADAEKVLELDPGNAAAERVVKRLLLVVTDRREKLKDEMMGKLKELGNMVLGKFGLSVDNFKTEQDPTTGSYSVKFQQ